VTAFFEAVAERPEIFDAARADDVLDSLAKAFASDAALAPAAALLRDAPNVRELLAAAFSGAPYLAALALRDPSLLADCLLRDADRHLDGAVAGLSCAVEAARTPKEVMAILRRFKRRIALLVGLADLGGVWSTEATLRAMSSAAETAADQAVAFLFRQARKTGQILAPAPSSGDSKGYFVIAMGKLGGHELNYSSDIDLIVFYDAERAGLAPGVEPSAFFVRLTRDLVRLLQEHTGDGYVFRTDLRLRPDPGATQVALSTDAGLTYYESFGQNWERAALIKARVIAGDRQGGVEFLHQLSPFIWRKYLDFAAIADIHAMKRRVHAHKGHGRIAVAGHDIKLGRGGIRDIEFFVQTQQLIVGGRHPELRTTGTLATLAELAKGGWIAPEATEELTCAYLFLRRVENRLQMIGDQQTHTLPVEANELRRVAALSGYADTAAFAAALVAQLSRVETHYGALFETLPRLPEAPPGLVLSGHETDPAARATLERLGFRNPDQAIAAVRAWQSGRYPATRSALARERLGEFLPSLLAAFGRTAEPDLALATFDKVMAEMPAGVQLFSLLAANPSLTRLVADIMGTAPRLAVILGRRPRLLDAVLDPGFFGAVPTPAKLKELVVKALAQSSDYQDALDRARIVGREQAFLIGVRVISGTISASQAGAAYAMLAETLIDTLAARVGSELERRHGSVPGGKIAIIAMGKLGGHEMTAGSDLDLITVYNFAGDAAQSTGPRSLPGSQYYTRLTQRLIAALSAQTPEGSLYQVDMRLRPSGNQGPVATSLASFTGYQRHSAWTWEHLALTRARVISGPLELRQDIERCIAEVLRRPRDRASVASAVRIMRGKIEDEKGTSDIWDLKHVRGGLIDIEFIAQFLQVVSAHYHPEVLDQNVNGALAKLLQARVITLADAEILAPAATLYQALTQCLRLCLDKPFVPDSAPRALKDLLARASDMPDFSTLEAMLKDTLAGVHAAFERLVV
jgi:[glutamine synthetase] adenylyltransferase / [glutamine synthetase]-adenylyl-L-tyrosine phosphorylase